MPHTFARAVLASIVALGALALAAAAAAAGSGQQVFISGTAATSSSSTPAPFAPLWVYPPTQSAYPVPIMAAPANTRSVVIVREQPSLLRPADLHFSVENEAGVTVVRGPIAR